MACISKRVKSFFNKINKKSESPNFLRDGGKARVELESPNFVRNGELLMENLLSLSHGREETHIKRFTIPEINKLTNNFEELFKDSRHCKVFKGNLDGRPILVQIYLVSEKRRGNIAFGTAISALMSHLKYTLKLIGCCTDLGLFAPVYEFAGTATLTDLLGENRSGALSWGNRVKIARDVAAMVLYLHTSFPLPIIYRDLKPSNVLIDRNGDAKLFDFSKSIEVPQGESEVETHLVAGTLGFLEPEYLRTHRVTTKSDVYSFGVILLLLLTGKQHPQGNEEGMHIRQYIEQFKDDDAKLIDHNIMQGVGVDEFRAIKDLALSCTEYGADYRPEMIDVARRLHEIEKLVNKPSCRTAHPL